jgi:hypothetical protein
MQLLTEKIKNALPALYSTELTPCDEKKIVVRFFNPMGAQSWQIAEGSEQVDGDWLLFGLCDLGFGNVTTTAVVDGKPVTVGLNAYIPKG